MNNKSIDGLRRRSNNNLAGVSARRKPVAKKPTAKKIAVSRPKAKKSLELPEKKHDLKELISENEELEVEQSRRERKAKQEDSVKDFLEEVRDVNPTDLSDIPPKERKKMKKEKKAKKGKKKHIVRKVVIVLLLLILAAGVGVYFYFNDFVAKITDGGSLLGVIFSDPDTPLKKDAMGRTNMIIFGTEGYDMDNPNYDGGFLTDSMMLVSIDQETGDAKAISLPRDLKATFACTGTAKFNEIYWCEYQKNNGSAESRREYETRAANKLGEAFTEVLGLEVHYHIHANWAALQSIVDTLGGLDVVFVTAGQTWDGPETTIETTSKKGLKDIGKEGKVYVDFPNGQVVHLDGAQALAVARVRNAFGGYGAANSNFNREVFQQRILEAMIKKARETNVIGDLMKVLSIKDAIGDNLRTDFKDTEIKTALKVMGSVDIAHLETISLYSTDDKPAALMRTGMINNISYVLPTAGVGNYEAIKAYVKKKLSSDAYTMENASIVVLNGTSASGIANKEKTELEDKGYTVSSIGNAPSDQTGFDGVRVYQKNSNKPKTAEALKKFYGVDIQTEIPDSLKDTKADFIVIIGAGFSHN